MAKQARVQQFDDQDAPAEPVSETITYIPGEGDAPVAKWGGHVFHANVPKEITGKADGNERERINHHIIERVREGNPSFVAASRGKKRRDPAADPKTADEYRAYLAKWLQDPSIQSPEQMIVRFARETDLRTACEVGSQDYEMIGHLFMPKLLELAKAMEMTEGQVAQIWLNNGFNQLPW